MKKLIYTLVLVFGLFGIAHAYELTSSDNNLSDTITKKIETIILNKGEPYRPKYIKALVDLESKSSSDRIKKIAGKVIRGLSGSNPDWSVIDTSCTKLNITIGSQVWAGCNSTIGSIAVDAEKNMQCYNSAGKPTTCAPTPQGKTFSTMIEPGKSKNIYGALYQYDAMNTNTCFGTGISASNTTCPCKDGYHVPTNAEWDTLETNLGCSEGEKLTGKGQGFECMTYAPDTSKGLGWLISDPANAFKGLGWTSTSTNSLKNKLGLTLAGYCSQSKAITNVCPQGAAYNGYCLQEVLSCDGRDAGGNYWSSSSYVTGLDKYNSASWGRALNYSYASIKRMPYPQTNAFSVRCIKD